MELSKIEALTYVEPYCERIVLNSVKASNFTLLIWLKIEVTISTSMDERPTLKKRIIKELYFGRLLSCSDVGERIDKSFPSLQD